MKVFVTGVNGQLGHDVMNELAKRGHEGIGSDLAPAYKGVADGSAVTTMPYVSLDITDKEKVTKVIAEVKPDAVIYCAVWTAVDMVETEKYGYYHATNAETEPGGYISWYDFCVEIYKQYGLKTNVVPVTTAEYGLSKATRSFNSRLEKSKLVAAGFTPLPGWKDAVRRYLAEANL